MNPFKTLAAVLAASTLFACGGGGGGTLAPPLALLFSPATIVLNFVQGTVVHVSEDITAQNLSDSVTITVEQLEQVIGGAVTVVQTGASTFAASFDTSQDLSPGRHTGSFRVHVFGPGQVELPGSPFLLPYDITVTAQSLSALIPYLDQTGLRLFDPRLSVSGSNPSAAVDPTTGYVPLVIADFDGTNFSNLHPERVLYVKGNTLFRVALAPSASHAPLQVSSLTTVCMVTRTYPDYATPDNSQLLVEVKDGSGTCGSATPVYRLVHAGATNTDAGVSVSGTRLPQAVRSASGVLLGFITFDRPAITWRDASYANPQALLTAFDSGDPDYHGLSFIDGDFTDTVYFVSRDAALSTPSLYRFRPSTGALTSITACCTSGVPTSPFGALDATNYYFGHGGAIYRVPHASTTVTRMSSASFTDELRFPRLTASRVVVESVNNGSTGGIYSLLKTDANASPVTIIDASHGFAYISNADAGGTVLITATHSGSGPYWSSWIAKDDGSSAVERPDSSWRIPVYDGAWNVLTRTAQRFVRIDDSIQSYPETVYDTATGGVIASLGGVNSVNDPYAIGFGRYAGLYMPVLHPGPSTDYDAFVIDTTAGTAIKPVLNAPAAAESGGYAHFDY